MSLLLTVSLRRSGPSGVAKVVLTALASYANNAGGDCFPSIPTIAFVAGFSTRTVQRALKRLIEDGWVEQLIVGNGAKHRSHYQLHLPQPLKKAAQLPLESIKKGDRVSPFLMASETPLESTKKGDRVSPIRVTECHPPHTPYKEERLFKGQLETKLKRAPALETKTETETETKARHSASHTVPMPKAAKRSTPSKRPLGASGNHGTGITPPRTSRTPPAKAGLAKNPIPQSGHSRKETPRSPEDVLWANKVRIAYFAEVLHGLVDPPPWGEAEWAKLAAFRRANPLLTLTGFDFLLSWRAESVNAGHFSAQEPPRFWLEDLMDFENGPLSRYGKLLKPKLSEAWMRRIHAGAAPQGAQQ